MPAETESRLSAVFEAAVDGMVIIDDRGVILSMNPAAEQMFGWDSQELLGKNVTQLMPSPYREEHDDYLRRYAKTSEKRIIGIGREVVGLHRSGRKFPVHLSVGEVIEGDSKVFAGILRDISEQKADEAAREELIAELELKNAELERFTYTVSHDLKSPLITIKGFVGQLEKSVASGKMERFRSDVARISSAADRLKTLLDDVLELSRIGRVVNPPEDVALDGVVAQTVELLSAIIRDRGATVKVHSNLPVVRGDRTRLGEIVQNLLENALKFSPEAPQIEVGAQVEGGFAVCCVRDRGVGIEKPYVDKIFGLFEQLDGDASGTGIGLALVRRIVDVHGGRTWAESAGLGHGTAIFFTLPLADAEETD